MTNHPLILATFIYLGLFTQSLQAQDVPAPPLWEAGIGAAGISQQAYPGSNERVNLNLVLPYFVYRGEILRADRGGAGLRAYKSDTLEVDIGLSGALGGGSDEVRARQNMPKLGTLVEFGPRLRYTLHHDKRHTVRIDVPLRGVFDISNQLAYQGVAFAPEVVHEYTPSPAWRVTSSLGPVLGNRALTDTFYGVDEAFATVNRPAYAAQSGLIAWRLGLQTTYQATPQLRLFGGVRLDSLQGSANLTSPLVERKTAASAAVGLIYSIWQSSTPAGQ